MEYRGALAHKRRAADAVGCSPGHIVEGIGAIEHCEGTPGLRRDDAAQGEMPDPGVFWPVCREIRYEAVTGILVRIRALSREIELVYGQVDERGEVAVVNCVRVGVVASQAEILNALYNGYRPAVVDGVGDVVVVVLQP